MSCNAQGAINGKQQAVLARLDSFVDNCLLKFSNAIQPFIPKTPSPQCSKSPLNDPKVDTYCKMLGPNPELPLMHPISRLEKRF